MARISRAIVHGLSLEFDISVAWVESVAEPDNMRDEIWREPVAFVDSH